MALKTLVVTKRQLNLRNIETVTNLKSASSREGLTTLIYVDSDDGYTDILTELAYIATKVDNIIYISDKVNHFIKYVVQLCDGYVIVDDGSYLEEDNLEWITTDIGSTGLEEKTSEDDMTKIFNTMTQIVNMAEEKKAQEIINMLFTVTIQKSLKASLDEVALSLKNDKLANDTLKKTARGIRNSMMDLQHDRDKIKTQLEEIKDVYSTKLDEVERGGVSLFPTYTVAENGSRVLYVRAYSPCRYLTTFLLTFTHYLRNEKNKDTKMLIVTSNQILYTKKYNNFTRLHSDNAQMMDLSKHNVYVTSEPKKSVLDAFFKRRNVKVFIVLDYTYNDRLIKGTSVKTFGAVGGSSDLERYDLDPRTTFTCMFTTSKSLPLRPIQNYFRVLESQRIKMVVDTHKDILDHLCRVLEV